MTLSFSELVRTKSTDELKLILLERYKYQPEMITAVTDELSIRAIDLSELTAQREILEEKEKELLSVGKNGNPLYIFVCFAASLVGGFAGIIGGYIYAFSKTISGEGEEFYVYNNETRLYGRIIFWVGNVVFICSLFLSVNRYFGL